LSNTNYHFGDVIITQPSQISTGWINLTWSCKGTLIDLSFVFDCVFLFCTLVGLILPKQSDSIQIQSNPIQSNPIQYPINEKELPVERFEPVT